jgi:pimeloyl-ACP methyl ester carboxylesterase
MNKKNIPLRKPQFILLIGIICTLFTSGLAHATTYYSPFHAFAVNHAIYTNYVTSGSHRFIVDGVVQHTWAELYVNGTYIPPSQESKSPFYYDPTFDRTIGTSDIIEIVVYNADNLSIWEKHKFIVDTTPPTNPTSFSSTPSINTWTTDNTVYVSWSGASDSGSGVQGYSIEWSTSSSTVPDTTKDTSSTSTTSSGLADGANWYLHIRTIDNAGNWANGALHCGPFKIDRTVPGQPTLSSPANTSTVTTTRPIMQWNATSDSPSGVQKYHLHVGTKWSPTWDKVDKDVTGTSYTLNSSETLSWESTYSWEVYAIDYAGNEGPDSAKWEFTVHDNVKPHNPSSYVSTPAANTWSNSATISVTWSGAYDNETGLDGYAVAWSQSSTTVPGTDGGHQDGTTSQNSPGNGVFTNIYCHVRAVDKASPANWADGALHCGPFNIDRENPGTPTQQSPSNGGSVTTLRPTLTWLAASDGYGSGVAKYHLKVFENWGLYIDKVDKDVTGTSYTLNDSEALQWGKNYGWRIYAIDGAGNSGAYTSNWYFTVQDNVKPHNPSSYTSTPAANTWSNLATISVTWSGAYDNETGLDGYAVAWSQSSTTVPGTDGGHQDGTTSQNNPGNGVFTNIYCHVRAVDKASPANWADGALHCGPFNIDRENPGTPTQQSPSNGGSVTTIKPALTWLAADDGFGSGVVKYHLKVVESWFPYIDKVDKDITGTSYTLSDSEALQWGSTYTWRLYAIDNAGNPGDYTAEWHFTVITNNPPPQPGRLWVEKVTNNMAIVHWGPSTDPDGDSVTYVFQINEDWAISWGEEVSTQATSTTIWNLDPDTTYDFRVWATDGKGGESTPREKQEVFKTHKKAAMTPSVQKGDFEFSTGDATDNSPLNDRIPVILVHGAGSDERPAALNYWYWWGSEDYFNNGSYAGMFKVYRFVYDSSKHIAENGTAFATFVNNYDELQGHRVIIMAHSMGGLVVRYALNTNSDLRDKTIKLITLGTPHLGSPGANPCWIYATEDGFPGGYIQWVYRIGFEGISAGDYDLAWYNPTEVPIAADDYYTNVLDDFPCNQSLLDNSMLDPFTGKAEMINSNSDSKIIAFAGYLGLIPVNGMEPDFEDETQFNHAGLWVAKDAMASVHKQNGSYFTENDGFVPLESARFDTHGNVERINITDDAFPQTVYLDHASYLDMSAIMDYVMSYIWEIAVSPSIVGDITGNGDVDFADLEVLAEQWLQPPGNPSADIAPVPNGDGIVNFLDFALMAENWMK